MQGHKCAYKLAPMSTLKDRIKQAREYGKLTQKQLAERVGVSQPVISQLERGDNLQSVHLLKIAEVCGVDPVWLANGAGEGPAEAIAAAETAIASVPGTGKTSSAADLVRAMLATKAGKALPQVDRERLLAVADEPEELPQAPRPSNVIPADFSRQGKVGDEFRIAHYDVRAALGGGQVVPDYPEMMPDLLVSRRHLQELGVTYSEESHLKMLTGYGQSMAPTIQHLDPMIVDVSIRDFQGDGIYAFTWHGHFYVKRLQVSDAEHFEMISDNPHHKDREIRIDETYIQARVLLIWNAKKG